MYDYLVLLNYRTGLAAVYIEGVVQLIWRLSSFKQIFFEAISLEKNHPLLNTPDLTSNWLIRV